MSDTGDIIVRLERLEKSVDEIKSLMNQIKGATRIIWSLCGLMLAVAALFTGKIEELSRWVSGHQS